MAMNRGRDYSRAVYNLCESIKARKILEVGLGAMASGLAFVESLSNRPPAFLTTIEANKDGHVPSDILAHAQASGVNWRVIHGSAIQIALSGQYDMVHLDSVGALADENIDAYNNLAHLVRPGGIYAIAGAGPGYPGIMEAGEKIGGFTLRLFDGISGHAVRVMP